MWAIKHFYLISRAKCGSNQLSLEAFVKVLRRQMYDIFMLAHLFDDANDISKIPSQNLDMITVLQDRVFGLHWELRRYWSRLDN